MPIRAVLVAVLLATGLPMSSVARAGAAGRDIGHSSAVLVQAAASEPNAQSDRAQAKASKPVAGQQARGPFDEKRLSPIEQRRRAAQQQRLLLQEKGLREQTSQSERQLGRIRDQQAETLRQQQEQQRQIMVQQRRLQQPQQPGQTPRLTPNLDRPLIEQRNPSCGVAGMPLC